MFEKHRANAQDFSLEQKRPVAVYEYMPSRRGQSLAAHLMNWQFRVLTRDGYEGYASAFREQGLDSRDIVTQVCLVHARRRICNAVNIDHFADIASQDDGVLFAASRFEKHSPQYLLCMTLAALSKLYGWEETKTRQKGESREQQLERILRYRREHCTALVDSVDEIIDGARGKVRCREERALVFGSGRKRDRQGCHLLAQQPK